MTSSELREATGLTRHQLQETIKRMKAEGRCEQIKTYRPSESGMLRATIGYKFYKGV